MQRPLQLCLFAEADGEGAEQTAIATSSCADADRKAAFAILSTLYDFSQAARFVTLAEPAPESGYRH